MIELVAFGIIVDDIVLPDGQTRMGVLGGGGVQTAWGMAAARGSGERVGLAARIGADLDETVLAPLRAAGINLDGLQITGLPTPRAWQVLEYDGQRTQVWRVPGPSIGRQLARSGDLLPPAYQNARAFHWGFHPGEAGSLAFAHELAAPTRRISLEPFRPPECHLNDDDLRAILGACEVFSPNWQEACRIADTDDGPTLLRRYRNLGGRILALRRGPEGADVWNLVEQSGVHVPAVETTVVDVVGAGNTFCGAFIARLDEGIETAACHASAAASYQIEQVGIPPTLPDPADYDRRLADARAGLRVLSWPAY